MKPTKQEERANQTLKDYSLGSHYVHKINPANGECGDGMKFIVWVNRVD